MAETSSGTRSGAGRPKGPPKRSRVVRLSKELDTALDIYSRVHKTPVSAIIEGLVSSWVDENKAVIEQGRDLFEGVTARRGKRKKPG
jgi:hypothetical protein